MKTALFILVCFWSSIAWGQKVEKDTIQKVWKDEEGRIRGEYKTEKKIDERFGGYFIDKYSHSDFSNAQFHSDAYFSWAKFHSDAYFSWAQFHSHSDFSNAQFHSDAYFSWAKFHSDAYFSWAKFDSLANFSVAQFDSFVYFYYTHFKSKADFSGIKGKGKLDFAYAQMPDTLLFLWAQDSSLKNIDLTQVSFDSLMARKKDKNAECVLYLPWLGIENLNLYQYLHFKLAFPDSAMAKMYFISEYTFEQKSKIYKTLLQKIKENGFEDSYEKMAVEYEELQYLHKADEAGLFGFFWLGVNGIQKYWWNYGYNRELVLPNTLYLLFLFYVINLYLFSFLNMKIYKIERIWEAFRNSYSPHIILWGSKDLKLSWSYIFYCFLYTAVIFFGIKMTLENIHYHKKWGVVYLYTQYITGLVCLAYLVGLVISN